MVAGYAKFLLPLFLSGLVTANNLPRAELTPALTGRVGTPKQGTDPVSLGLVRRQAQCPGGSILCDDGAGCCDYTCCGTGCCDAGELCYDDDGPALCCEAYTEAKCQDSCMPFDGTCCGDGTYVSCLDGYIGATANEDLQCLWGNRCVPGGCVSFMSYPPISIKNPNQLTSQSAHGVKPAADQAAPLPSRTATRDRSQPSLQP